MSPSRSAHCRERLRRWRWAAGLSSAPSGDVEYVNTKTGEKVYLRKPQATPPRDYYDELDDAKPAPAAAREPWHDEQQSGGRLSSLRAKALGKAESLGSHVKGRLASPSAPEPAAAVHPRLLFKADADPSATARSPSLPEGVPRAAQPAEPEP